MSEISITITDFSTDPPLVTDLASLGITLLNSSNIQLLPGLEVRTIKIPGRGGSMKVGVKRKSRDINLDLHLTSDSIDGLINLKNTLASLIDPTKEYIELSFSHKPNKYYKVRYSGSSPIREYPVDSIITIPFKMFDPYIYGPLVTSNDSSLNNTGNIPCDLIIELSGPATNSELSIGSSIITYNDSIDAGSKLIINGETGEVMLGTLNALPAMSGDLPSLRPGTTNVSCSSGTATYKWRAKYTF